MAGGIAVSNRVVARNGMGRFIAACEKAAHDTVEEAVKEGAKLSKAMAPRGEKADPRTPSLHESIYYRTMGRTQGEWGANARHAMAIEKGARRHDIPADVHFFWDKMNRMWMPPALYEKRTGFPGADPIDHPGNAAQPYLRPAYEEIMARLMSIARSKYPG